MISLNQNFSTLQLSNQCNQLIISTTHCNVTQNVYVISIRDFLIPSCQYSVMHFFQCFEWSPIIIPTTVINLTSAKEVQITNIVIHLPFSSKNVAYSGAFRIHLPNSSAEFTD